jgi:transposase
MNEYSTCTVGIDLGDRKSVACIYSPGVVVDWFEFAMTPDGVRAAFAGKGYRTVAMEAGAQSGWVTRLLQDLGYKPLVANPRKLKAISANERKSDRNDALILAKLVTADASLLHPIEHRSEARELGMTVLRSRDTLVRTRTKLISTVRAMCKGVGARLKSGGADGFASREAEVPEVLAPATAGLFAALRVLNEQIAAYDTQLEVMLETQFPEGRLVRQVRGVGPVTALAFVLTIEDPKRFPDGRTAAAYLGLVPRRDQSGAVDKQLGISKTGNTFVRRLLTQCAQYILGPLGHDCDLRRWGHTLMARGGKSAKKRAITATARKLAVLLFRLWKRDEVWIPLYNADSSSAPPADADRPKPAVLADCACDFDDTGDRGRRRIDCSATDGSDPSMHQPQAGQPKSANRSVGNGTTSSAKKAPKKNSARQAGLPPAHPATANGDRGGPKPGEWVAPSPGPGAPSSAAGSHGGPQNKDRGPLRPATCVGPQPPRGKLTPRSEKDHPHP